MNYTYIFGGVGIGIVWFLVGIFSGAAFIEALEKRNSWLATCLGAIIFIGSVIFWPVGWVLLVGWQILRVIGWVIRRMARAVGVLFEVVTDLGQSVGCRI